MFDSAKHLPLFADQHWFVPLKSMLFYSVRLHSMLLSSALLRSNGEAYTNLGFMTSEKRTSCNATPLLNDLICILGKSLKVIEFFTN